MFTTLKEIRDYVEEITDEEVVLFDNYDYATAFIGLTEDNKAVYDYDKMVEYLIKQQGFEEQDALDFISFNSSFGGHDGYPVIVYPAHNWNDK